MVEPLEIPELVRQRAAALGTTGRDWLSDLPEAVATLTQRWGLELGATFGGGTASFVAGATDSLGRPCVLKVAMPDEFGADADAAFQRSVLTHQLAAGRACAVLFEHDPAMRAMLMERLGPNCDELGLPLPQLLETVVRTLRTFWQPVAEDCGLPNGPEKAAWLSDYITTSWEELGQPCPRNVIERAVEYCDERSASFDPTQAVLVHGDAHGWNTVEAGKGTFKFVDPEGLRSEPAHDLSVPMREYNRPLLDGPTSRLVRQRAELLAGWCDVDPEAVWQWGFIERVSTGLANLRDFDDDGGAIFLQVAERSL
jgi:streptomycin 6-kinase